MKNYIVIMTDLDDPHEPDVKLITAKNPVEACKQAMKLKGFFPDEIELIMNMGHDTLRIQAKPMT
jgi:hypothetical protein